MTGFTPDTENNRELRAAFSRFATGVCVVTAVTPSGPIGMTANSFSSVSLSPPLILWCPAKSSVRTQYFTAASHFAVHVLCTSQSELADSFARDGRAFDGLEMSAGHGGVPLIAGCAARFECAARAVHDAGDHLIQIGEVLRAKTGPAEPLVFSCGGFGRFKPV